MKVNNIKVVTNTGMEVYYAGTDRKQPIRTRYLGHVTGYQPIRDQYFLIRSVPVYYAGTPDHTRIQRGSDRLRSQTTENI